MRPIQGLVDAPRNLVARQCKRVRHSPARGRVAEVERRGSGIRAARPGVFVAARLLPIRVATFALFCVCWGAAAVTSSAPRIEASASAIAHEMAGRRVVLLGETHDNAVQHDLRLGALRAIVAKGSRPAIAFEQFDRDHQSNIERARRERPHDADYLIEQVHGDAGWDWRFYRPFVELALQYDLPIVATNLSREDAMQVAIAGWSAVFDPGMQRSLHLEALPQEVLRGQREAVAAGHCNLLNESEVEPLARAQIARDIVMAQAIAPYMSRGVVLLAGNGHVRRDIGVPRWLPPATGRDARSIGLLEEGETSDARNSGAFDAYVVTRAASRPDPCIELSKRLRGRGPKR